MQQTASVAAQPIVSDQVGVAESPSVHTFGDADHLTDSVSLAYVVPIGNLRDVVLRVLRRHLAIDAVTALRSSPVAFDAVSVRHLRSHSSAPWVTADGFMVRRDARTELGLVYADGCRGIDVTE